MVIEGPCVKCGKIGTQEIYRAGGRHNPNAVYLRYNHKNPRKRCYIGRVSSTDEAFGEILNEPTTIEEYDEALRSMVEGVKAAARRKKYRQLQPALMSDLQQVFRKYGLH